MGIDKSELDDILLLCRKSLFDNAIELLLTHLPASLFVIKESKENNTTTNENSNNDNNGNDIDEVGIDMTKVSIDVPDKINEVNDSLQFDSAVDPLDICSYLFLLCLILYWQGLAESNSKDQFELLTIPNDQPEPIDPFLEKILKEEASKEITDINDSSIIVKSNEDNDNNNQTSKKIHFNLVFKVLSELLEDLINKSTILVPPSPLIRSTAISSDESSNYLKHLRLTINLLEADRFSASILSKYWRKNYLFYESHVSPLIGISLNTVFAQWPEKLNENTYYDIMNVIFGNEIGSITHLFTRIVAAELPYRKSIYELLQQYEHMSKTYESYNFENISFNRALTTRRAYLLVTLRSYKEGKGLFDLIIEGKVTDIWTCLAFTGIAYLTNKQVSLDSPNTLLTSVERIDNTLTCMFLYEENIQRYRELSLSSPNKYCPASHIELFSVLSYCELLLELENIERLRDICISYLQTWNNEVKVHELLDYGQLIPGLLTRYVIKYYVLSMNPDLSNQTDGFDKAQSLVREKLHLFRTVLGPMNLSYAELLLSLSEDCIAYSCHYSLRGYFNGYSSGNDRIDVLRGIHSDIEFDDLAILSENDNKFKESVLLAEETIRIYRNTYESTGNEAHLHGASRSFRLLSRLFLLSTHPERMQLSKGYLEKAMEIYREIGGIGVCNDLAEIQFDLGRILTGNNESEEAIGVFDQSLDVYRQLYGDTHISVAQVCYLKAQAMQDIKFHEDSEELILEALNIYRSIFTKEGDEDNVFDIADCLASQGLIHQELDEWEEAKELYTKALTVYTNALGKHNIEKNIRVAKVLNNLGSMNQALNDLDEAKSLYETAMLMLIKQGKEESMHMYVVLENLINLYKDEILKLRFEKRTTEMDIKMQVYYDSIEFFSEKLNSLMIKLSTEIEAKESKIKQYQDGLNEIAKQRDEQKKQAELERKKKFKEYMAAKQAESWKNNKCTIM